MIGLAVPPFAILERGFYKSSAGVFVGCAVLFLCGKLALVSRVGASPGRIAEIAAWTLFTVVAALYMASLWGEDGRRRARSFTATLACGLIALTVSATLHRLGPVLSPATVLYPLAFLTGALAL